MFFNRKKIEPTRDKLEKAKEMGFITDEEFLKLKVERAERKLKEFLSIRKRKK